MGQFEAFVGVNFWTALFILLNTLTIFFVAKKFLFGPVMKIIHERQQEIDDMYTKAGEAKEQAKLLRQEYEDKLSAATETSDRLVKEAVAAVRPGRKKSSVRPTPRPTLSVRRPARISRRRRRKHSTMLKTRSLKWLWQLQRRSLAVS